MREKILAAAIAIVTFGVVSGSIVGFGLATANPAHAAAAAILAGDWKGAYVAADGAGANTFDARLKQNGAVLTGTVTEPNTFGDRARAMFLTSTLAGTVRGDDVRFVKTYDGSGGVSHAVTYQGRLDATGRRVRGDYSVNGATGSFEMVR